MNTKNFVLALLSVAVSAGTANVLADTVEARCDLYPAGEDKASQVTGCHFSQRQGYINIALNGGATYDLSPTGDTAGNYTDQQGRPVYRESGLGDQGLIFRFPDQSVYVYWSTAGLQPADADNPTAPFSTADYDATALLRCKAAGAQDFATCPAGILRMEDNQASIVVQGPAGEQFTINFMTGYVNATNREVDAHLDGDTWTVTIDGGDVYEVPLAAIEGG